MLQDMPVRANCHSFSKDGKTIAMDVDAIDDKGAYDIRLKQAEELGPQQSTSLVRSLIN